MVYGATIFHGAKSPHREIGTKEFLKVMGGTDGGKTSKDAVFVPPEYETKDLYTDGTIEESYFNSMTDMMSLGMELSAKGINPLSPVDWKNPEAVMASRVFHDMLGRTNRNAAALKSKNEMFKIEQNNRIKKGVVDMNPGDPTDPNSLVNVETAIKPYSDAVEQSNDNYAQEFKTEDDTIRANAELQKKKESLAVIGEQLDKMGITDPALRQGFIKHLQESLGMATTKPEEIDPLLEEKRKKLEAETAAKNRSNRGTKKSTKEDELKKRALVRKDIIYGIQRGDLSSIGKLQDGKNIVSAKLDVTGDVPTLKIRFKDAKEAPMDIPVEKADQSDGSFGIIDNLLDRVEGRAASERIPEHLLYGNFGMEEERKQQLEGRFNIPDAPEEDFEEIVGQLADPEGDLFQTGVDKLRKYGSFNGSDIVSVEYKKGGLLWGKNKILVKNKKGEEREVVVHKNKNLREELMELFGGSGKGKKDSIQVDPELDMDMSDGF